MLDFVVGSETKVLNDPNNTPVTTAFVIVESDKGFMLLYNKYRRLWELAGGVIEQGESSRDCVIRECREESNQEISDLRFVGLAKLLMGKNEYRENDSVEFSAVYHAFLDKENPFAENDEIKELRWWKPVGGIADFCRESMEMIGRYIGTKAS